MERRNESHMSSQYYWVIKTKETGKYWTPSGEDSVHLQDAEHFPDRESARAELEDYAPKGHSVVVHVRRKDQKV
jgi:hypothetical protein